LRERIRLTVDDERLHFGRVHLVHIGDMSWSIVKVLTLYFVLR
jgi:hypothetical protein